MQKDVNQSKRNDFHIYVLQGLLHYPRIQPIKQATVRQLKTPIPQSLTTPTCLISPCDATPLVFNKQFPWVYHINKNSNKLLTSRTILQIACPLHSKAPQ